MLCMVDNSNITHSNETTTLNEPESESSRLRIQKRVLENPNVVHLCLVFD
jgi:hypothetical protein